jgi:3-hydroxybenzoate 6-monooxygenase
MKKTSSKDDLAAALAAYRDRRIVRTSRIVLQSRAFGDHIYHSSGAHALVRNAMLKAKSQSDLREDLAWLYDIDQTGVRSSR